MPFEEPKPKEGAFTPKGLADLMELVVLEDRGVATPSITSAFNQLAAYASQDPDNWCKGVSEMTDLLAVLVGLHSAKHMERTACRG